MTASRLASAVLAAACLLRGGVAAAQPATTADNTPTLVTQPEWELEFHGGLSFDRGSTGGSASLPTTGSTVGGLISLSTFYFGQGAALYNQARPGSPIVPLDSAVGGAAIERARGGDFGMRVQRAINPRFAVEFNGDVLLGDQRFRSSALSALEASRASFVTALQGTLGASASAAPTSALTLTDHVAAQRVIATGSIVTNLVKTGHTIPYLVVGAGVVFRFGDLPQAKLVGKYQIGASSILYGTDTVTLNYTDNGRSVVYLGGAGLKHVLSRHTGVRIDARVHVNKSTTLGLVSVAPDKALASTGGPIPIVTLWALQFSALGPLNGAAYQGAQSFTSSGYELHVATTAGIYFRF